MAQAIELADVAAGRGGFVIEGEGRLASSVGWSVANAGDVNGDGIPDAIVGGTHNGYFGHPTPTYVVFGRPDGQSIKLEDVAADQGGFAIRAEDAFWRVGGATGVGAGDVNGDGLADLIVLCESNSYVVFGKKTTEPVDLETLEGSGGGFAINGEGRSVSGAGDVNGDGLADVLIGNPYWAPGGDRGWTYVVFGKSTPESVDLSSVAAGQGGFVIRCEEGNSTSRTGWSLSRAGDVNGDGLADVLIGAPCFVSSECPMAQASYVVFGKVTTEAVDLSAVAAGVGGFVIRRDCVGSVAGYSVSGAGDVNGDGLADVIIGAPCIGPCECPLAISSYVVFGKATTETIELSAVAAGEGGFVIRGEGGDDVSGAGDVNGDGHADLLVGAPSTDHVYVIFGRATTEAVELSAVTAGQGGFVIRAASDCSLLGVSVSDGGDVNGDGLSDLLMGAPGRSSGCSSPGSMTPYGEGITYIAFGKPNGDPVEVSAIAAGQGGHAIVGFGRQDYSCSIIAALGDVNGDGLQDLLVGSGGASYSSGATYVAFGKSGTDPVDLSAIAKGQGGFVIRGANARDRTGCSVAAAGDVNGDGVPDILINSVCSGSVEGNYISYVVFGKATTESVQVSDVAAGHGGFAIRCWRVNAAGDVNGDGLGDLVVEAPEGSCVVFGKVGLASVDLATIMGGEGGFAIRGPHGGGGSPAGDVNGDGLGDFIVGLSIVFGKRGTEAVDLSAVGRGEGGFEIQGQLEGGCSVAFAGDVNGDGLADVLIGDWRAAPEGRESAGVSYVIFGKKTTEAVELSGVLAGRGGFAIRGEKEFDYTGASVSGAGDVNGDGLADILIGAPGVPPARGTSYIVFGKSGTEPIDLSAVSRGEGGVVIGGETEGYGSIITKSGSSVAGLGDMNGDGIPDFAIGARGQSGSYNATDGRAYVVFGPARESLPRFRRGDANGDDGVDIADAISLLSHLFASGTVPACKDAADANDDGKLGIADAVTILSHLFAAAGPLKPPCTECGSDPTTDGLDCLSFRPCGN